MVRKYAGTHGALVVTRKSCKDAWTVVGGVSDVDADIQVDVEAGAKRSRNASEDGEPALKRVRLHEDGEQNGTSSSAPSCLAPSPSQEIQSLLRQVEKGDYELFAGDLFLTEDFRDRWCKCTSVRPTTKYPCRTVLEWDFFSSVRSRCAPTLTSSLRKTHTNHPQIQIRVSRCRFSPWLAEAEPCVLCIML